jgi:predicted RNase H-like nuclease (RuvC/YqgF family)
MEFNCEKNTIGKAIVIAGDFLSFIEEIISISQSINQINKMEIFSIITHVIFWITITVFLVSEKEKNKFLIHKYLENSSSESKLITEKNNKKITSVKNKIKKLKKKNKKLKKKINRINERNSIK